MENTNKRGAYIALSILIAIVLWVYVGYINSNEDTYTIRNVPVVFTGEEDMLIWVTDDDNRIPVCFEAPILVGTASGRLAGYSGLKHPFTALVKK